MSLKVLKNEKNISQNKKGDYVFEHVLVQELGQSNVNAIVESNTNLNARAKEFVSAFDQYTKNQKKVAKANIDKRKKESEEFLASINDKNKSKLAIEYLDRLIAGHENIIKNYKNIIKETYKGLKKKLEPEKSMSLKAVQNSSNTLKIWKKFYKKEDKKEW